MSNEHGPVRVLVERAIEEGENYFSVPDSRLRLRAEADSLDAAVPGTAWEPPPDGHPINVGGTTISSTVGFPIGVGYAAFNNPHGMFVALFLPDDGYEYAVMRRKKGSAE